MKNTEYTGKKLSEGSVEFDIPPYDPDNGLVTAVNIAIALKRPLLVRGMPGTGKSRLAESIAFDLYGKDYKNHLFEWKIKSTSKAKDGLYSYDHLKRLRDAQMKESVEIDIDKHDRYLKFGPLGQAFLLGAKEKNTNRPIILIDEIDKAEIDFPNDLLTEMENKEFEIDEIDENQGFNINLRGVTVKISKKNTAKSANPIIIITSNDERELSDAFLRRCIFYYIDLPDKEKLIAIVKAHLKFEYQKANDGDKINVTNIENNITTLVGSFFKLQKEMLDEEMNKIPTTSEVLDFIKSVAYLHQQGTITKEQLQQIDPKERPFISTLIKTANDWERYLGKGKRE